MMKPSFSVLNAGVQQPQQQQQQQVVLQQHLHLQSWQQRCLQQCVALQQATVTHRQRRLQQGLRLSGCNGGGWCSGRRLRGAVPSPTPCHLHQQQHQQQQAQGPGCAGSPLGPAASRQQHPGGGSAWNPWMCLMRRLHQGSQLQQALLPQQQLQLRRLQQQQAGPV
jgi:hypothetical protein